MIVVADVLVDRDGTSAGTHLLLPLPEMTFADNHLELTHNKSGFKYRFEALESLAEVRVGAGWEQSGGGVKVKHAEEWGKTRSARPSSHRRPSACRSTEPLSGSYVSERPLPLLSLLILLFRRHPSSRSTGRTHPSTRGSPRRPPRPRPPRAGGRPSRPRSSRSPCSPNRTRSCSTTRSHCLSRSSTTTEPRSSTSASSVCRPLLGTPRPLFRSIFSFQGLTSPSFFSYLLFSV